MLFFYILQGCLFFFFGWISSWPCQAPASNFSDNLPLLFCSNFTTMKQLNPAAYEHPANAISPQYCPSQT